MVYPIVQTVGESRARCNSFYLAYYLAYYLDLAHETADNKYVNTKTAEIEDNKQIGVWIPTTFLSFSRSQSTRWPEEALGPPTLE